MSSKRSFTLPPNARGHPAQGQLVPFIVLPMRRPQQQKKRQVFGNTHPHPHPHPPPPLRPLLRENNIKDQQRPYFCRKKIRIRPANGHHHLGRFVAHASKNRFSPWFSPSFSLSLSLSLSPSPCRFFQPCYLDGNRLATFVLAPSLSRQGRPPARQAKNTAKKSKIVKTLARNIKLGGVTLFASRAFSTTTSSRQQPRRSLPSPLPRNATGINTLSTLPFYTHPPANTQNAQGSKKKKSHSRKKMPPKGQDTRLCQQQNPNISCPKTTGSKTQLLLRPFFSVLSSPQSHRSTPRFWPQPKATWVDKEYSQNKK